MQAMIHSLGAPDEIDQIIKLPGDNKYKALYRGKWCTAIFNPFTGYYYVDDLYGVLPD